MNIMPQMNMTKHWPRRAPGHDTSQSVSRGEKRVNDRSTDDLIEARRLALAGGNLEVADLLERAFDEIYGSGWRAWY